MNLPKARTENLVEQNLGAETLIYDLTTHKAFNLNETLSVVYKACDGKTSFEDLKRSHQLSDDLIFLALDELKASDLLADDSYTSPLANFSRREAIKKVGLASAVALPLIVGIIAPTAISAASGEEEVVCVRRAACSCSVTNTTGEGALCGAELGGTSTNCGSSGGSGCDCIIPDGTDQGICLVFA